MRLHAQNTIAILHTWAAATISTSLKRWLLCQESAGRTWLIPWPEGFEVFGELFLIKFCTPSQEREHAAVHESCFKRKDPNYVCQPRRLLQGVQGGEINTVVTIELFC